MQATEREHSHSGFGHDKSQAILPYRALPNPPLIFFFGDGVSGEPPPYAPFLGPAHPPPPLALAPSHPPRTPASRIHLALRRARY